MSVQKRPSFSLLSTFTLSLNLIGCGQMQTPAVAPDTNQETLGGMTLYSASSTNPTSAVAISRMIVTPSPTSAKIQFDTKAAAGVTWVYYGTTPSTPLSILNRTYSTAHTIVLENLVPATTYYFSVSVRGGPGENDSTYLQTFSTLTVGGSSPIPTTTTSTTQPPVPAPAPTPTNPPPTSSGDPSLAISQILVIPSLNSAQIKFVTASPTSTNWVYYGTGGTTSLSILSRDLTANHVVTLSGLSPGTKYSYSLLVRGGPGISAQTTVGTFTTLTTTPLPAPVPTPAPIPAPAPTPTPVPSPVPAPTPSCMTANEQATLALINAYRVANGASALKASRPLNNAARWMSQDLAVNNNTSHTDSLGRTPSVRTAAFGFTGGGENIAGGNCTPQKVFEAWRNSAGHNTNMLNPSWGVIGLGYYEGAGTYYCYWTANFGWESPAADICN